MSACLISFTMAYGVSSLHTYMIIKCLNKINELQYLLFNKSEHNVYESISVLLCCFVKRML